MRSHARHAGGVRATAPRWLALAATTLIACGGSGISVCPQQQPCVHFVGPSGGTGGNGASDDGGAVTVADMAHAPPDLGAKSGDMASSPSDLASTPADLLSCVAAGGNCSNHNDAICCSHYCVYATNTCR